MKRPPLSCDLSRVGGSQFKKKYCTEMCSGSEEGSYLRRTDFFVSLNSRFEGNEEEEEGLRVEGEGAGFQSNSVERKGASERARERDSERATECESARERARHT